VNRNGGEVVEVEAFRPLALNHAGQHRHAGEQCTVPPILPPQDGYRFLDRAKFHTSFAADVSEAKAAFMADSQVPWGVNAVSGAVTEPAWKIKPSWYLVATDDKMIPPPVQRQIRSALARRSWKPRGATRSIFRIWRPWRRSLPRRRRA
jgi:hypothetical protein